MTEESRKLAIEKTHAVQSSLENLRKNLAVLDTTEDATTRHALIGSLALKIADISNDVMLLRMDIQP